MAVTIIKGATEVINSALPTVQTTESLNSVVDRRKDNKKWFTEGGIVHNSYTMLLPVLVTQPRRVTGQVTSTIPFGH